MERNPFVCGKTTLFQVYDTFVVFCCKLFANKNDVSFVANDNVF